MLDHIFISVSDLRRSIAFYTAALAPLGIVDRLDYDGKDGPPGCITTHATTPLTCGIRTAIAWNSSTKAGSSIPDGA